MPRSRDEYSHRRTIPNARVNTQQSGVTPAAKAENTKHASNKYNQHHQPESNDLVFYPAFCHKISPTWFTWAKLTAWQIHHALEPRNGFHALPDYDSAGYNRNPPLLLFYLNHPIQFVQVVGVVVSREEYFEKFWMFTVDDGSGATIDVTYRKPEKNETAKNYETPNVRHHSQLNLKSKNDDVNENDDQLNALLTSARVNIGTVVQAKGTITTFRQVRQLYLHRLAIVPSTATETSLISARTAFQTTILAKPWKVDSATQEVLKKKARGETHNENEREKRRTLRDKQRKLREERHAAQILKVYEEEESERRYQAEIAKRAGEVLQHKHLSSQQPVSATRKTSSVTEAEEGLDEGIMLLKKAFGK